MESVLLKSDKHQNFCNLLYCWYIDEIYAVYSYEPNNVSLHALRIIKATCSTFKVRL